MRISMLAIALVLLGAAPAGAADPYEIPVILPLTGSGAFIGLGQQQALQLAEKIVNAEGGIAGRPVRFVIHDDETNPQVSVQIASQLIANHPPVILGPSLSANCRAVLPLMSDGPVDYCYSPAINPEPGSYVFSPASSRKVSSRP